MIQTGNYRIKQVPQVVDNSKSVTYFSPELGSTFCFALNIMTGIVWCLYFWYELTIVRRAQEIAGHRLWRMWFTVAGELGVLIPDSFVSFEVILASLFERNRPGSYRRYRLQGDAASSIDIAIPCCGEDPDIIMDTLIAATSQDYPSHRYRVFVLDDSKDATLDRIVSKFKAGRKESPLIVYVARPKPPGVRHYFKGGNVRNGYEVSSNLGQGSEYFASFDADMIPEHDCLRRLVPHLILHGDLALACAPQVMNLPPAIARADQLTHISTSTTSPTATN